MAKRGKAGSGTGPARRALTGRDIVLVVALNVAVGWLLRAESPDTFNAWLDVAMCLVALAAGLGLLATLATVPPRQMVEADDPDQLALPPSP